MRSALFSSVGRMRMELEKAKNKVAASGVVKVLVSFYRSGEDSAFERHRSRVMFDLAKQSSVAAVKKHLTEFLGLPELALKFGKANFELKLTHIHELLTGHEND